MNLFKKIRRIFDKISDVDYFYVTFDICPDSFCYGEMCSYVVRAKGKATAIQKAQDKAMKDWGVGPDCLYLVDCILTKSDELIYEK